MDYLSRTSSLGNTLIDFCRQTENELVLIAPFIKASALDRILSSLHTDINLLCVTRWLPSEIAAGSSDVFVFEIVNDCNGSLWLRQDLHAKYYRSDEHVLIGSANLTNSALGWTINPNLEILIPVDRSTYDIADFERHTLDKAVEVDLDLYDTMVAASEKWSQHEEYEPDTLAYLDHRIAASTWVPVSRFPANLYKVYKDINSDMIPNSTREAGLQDLSILQPPGGLEEELFNQTIGITLLTLPVINLIDHHATTSQRFGVIRDLIKHQLNLSHDEASRAWQTIIRWLRHFLPGRYEYSRPQYSEIITRVKR